MKIAFSTGSLYTCGLARETGFDGIEIMIDLRATVEFCRRHTG